MAIKRVQSEAGKNFEVALKNLQGKVGKVGWFENSHYPVKPSKSGPSKPIQVAQIAAIQEFGNPNKNIPARPFMRTTIYEKENTWKRQSYYGSKKIIKGEWKIEDLMEYMGQKSASDIRKKITQIFSPALAESTILARIHKNSKLSRVHDRRFMDEELGNITKPLIDSGLMYGTLINKVEDE